MIERLAGGWRRFFHEPASVLPMAALRIALGVLLLFDAATLAPDLDALFGPRGIVPPALAHEVTQGFRIDLLSAWPDSPDGLRLFFALYLTAVVLFTFGLFTRAATIATFVGLVSLHHRNGLILNSADDLMRVALFWMIFSPAGHALSLDARRGSLPATAPPFAQRMLQINLSLAYLSTVWLKLHGPSWIDGTAVYYATRIFEFRRFPVPFLLDHLWTIRLLTWGTLLVESAMATIVWWRPARPWVLGAVVGFHLGLDWTMNLPLMQWTMIACMLVFVEPAWIEAVRSRLARRTPVSAAPA